MNKRIILAILTAIVLSFQLCSCGDTSHSKRNDSTQDTTSFKSKNLQATVSTSDKTKSAEEVQQDYRKLLCEKCPGKELAYVYFGDYDKDGIYEMFAFVADKGWDKDNIQADIYYVNHNGADCIQSGKSYYPSSNAFCKLSNTTMFKTEEGYSGSGSVSHAWIVKDGSKVFNVENTAEGLQQLDGDDFIIQPSAYDFGFDGTGHTWKSYYLHWNGNAFEEYGGIKISEEDLCKAKGGKVILEKIKSGGNTIGDIFYRGNGIVNINYHNDSQNMYATLSYDNGSVKDVTSENNAGIYFAAFNSNIAIYPTAWPLS